MQILRTSRGQTTRVQPETRYAKSGDVSIAYQVVGEGPFDVVYVPGWCPTSSAVAGADAGGRLSTSSLVRPPDRFRQAGHGHVRPGRRSAPTLETRMDDVRAVMDAAGSARAVLSASRRRANEHALRSHVSGAHDGARPDEGLRSADLGARLPVGSDRGSMATVMSSDQPMFTDRRGGRANGHRAGRDRRSRTRACWSTTSAVEASPGT